MGLNRIYKVVWNKTKGCYVVVSELAKRVGRNKAKAIVMSTAAMAMAVSPVLTSTVGAALNQAGTGSDNAVALGEAANANQARAVAIGKGATISSGQDTIAIGSDTNAKGHTSIVIGKNAKTTNDAEGTVVIGRDAFSEGSGNGGRPNTVVGRGAYTAFGLNGEYRLNAATAFGFQAGAGLRTDSKNSNKLINNETNADNNAEVLVKAGYGLDEKAPADTKAALQGGNVDKNLTFYRKNHINEATALGAEARAIGDQSIAIGGQVVAGDGVVALGGNDTDALRGNKYQVVTDDAVRGTNVNTVDDYNLRYTESTTTVAGQYKNLVGRDMPTAYKSTYGQSGSVVIGMEAHSTTALGTAIGTNSVVRMGAFGATAIGAGSTVQPNAEAAVAIGMGSVANGAYALAGGTASWADYGDIALGYQAKATGKDGAIAMGRATNAQGDSSIMIGGANIASAAAQMTNYQKDNGQVVKKTVTEKINGKDVKREYTFAGTTPSTGSVADAYKVLTGLTMETTALDFARNKNGHASTSLGVHALSKGDLGTAIGAGSRSDAIGSVALGVGAHATRQNAVAIGTGSTTDLVGTRQLSVSYDKEGNIVDDNSPNKAYTFNWAGGTNTAEGDVVSFGSSGAERQLKNVAAGRVADDSTDAINGSQLNSISKKLATGWNIAGDPKTKVAGIGTDDQVNFVNGNGTTVTVTKQEEVKNGNTVTTAKGANVKFDVKAADGSITSDANGISVNTDGDTIGKTADGKLKANTGTINTGDDGKAAPNTGDGNKLATVDTVVNAVNNAAWKATAGNDGSGTETGKSEEKIKAGDLVTFKAGDNLAIKQEGKNFIYSLKPELTGLTSAGFKNAAGDTTVIDGNGMTITPKDAPAKPVSLTKDGLDNGGKTIKNVTSGLTNYDPGTPKAGLVDLSKPATGTPVPDTTAATVGDLRNMGWVVSSDKTTGELTKAYTEQVKNADEVKFVGEGGVTVSGKTENGVRTITVKAEAQEMPEQPVSYTTADGTKVYPKTVTKPDGTKDVKYYSEPNGKGTEIPKENVIASINGPEGTKAPTTLSNVAGNLDGAKKDTQAPTTEHAPVNTTDAAAPNYVNPNNAATVGDVLNAGWNLQNNGTAKDFVKPYDTVNFVDGANTTAVVTTSADGTTSDVTYNVTGLPVTYTDKDGKPVSKIGDKYYPVNEKGQPITPDGKPAVKTNAEGKPVAEDGTVIEPVDTTKPLKTALVNPTPAGDKTNTTDPTALNNVTSGLNKYGDTVDGAQVPGSTPANNGLVDLSKPADGSEPKVSDNTAATVGDLRNMGWIVSSDKTTGDLGNPYSEAVKNANEVKFVGEGTATVSGKTDEKGVRTITVKVDDQASANNAVSPVVYTDENGDRVYPTGEKDPQGNPIFKKNPDGTGDTVTGPVKTSINGPKGTKTPATLDNVKHNLPTVNDADKKASDVDGNPIDGKNNTAAPITAKEAADLLNPTKDGQPNPNFVGNNAATVSDVLNAGWNLQNNGEARDFVKPYDTVNFVNGANTTAVVTTNEDGTTSNVTYNVTGLPVTFTDKDGKPVSKIGDKYYPVNEKGQPVTPDGKPAVKTNAEGKPVTADGTVIEPIDTKANPLQSNLVNPNVENTKEKSNNQTTSPTQLGNVANGANTFDPVDGKKLGNDGKWYNAADVLPNGQPKENVQPVVKPENVGKAGLIDFSNSNPNNAATVGDLQNLGWIVSAEGNNYSDQVRNANEVKFVGKGTATVTGETDANGVRTITVKVDDQVSTNNAVTPVVYTDKEGNTVYPIKDDKGNVTYHTTPDGKGENDKVVPNGDVNTSVNGPKDEKGNARPASLGNVKNNIPAVNDSDKKVTNPDGTEKGTAGDVNNINKAPLTATEAADLLNPTKDGKPNPNFVGNNAATVSDVLNAGWNLQNNGTAKDFVKPYDTVNFVDGANTTAVVTTNEDGTTSNVTYNVTGLPVTFTDKDGKPVSKIGDKYYPVNEKGQPVTPDGKPAVKTNAEGKPVTEDGTVIEPIDTAKDPLKSNMVNPNVANTADAPNNQTTTPTQLGNVKSNLPTVNDADKKASDVDGNPIDGKNNTAAPITAADAADLLNPTKDGKPNPKFAGNNAATVSDVLNAGWNLQNNGTAKDFVKPYDTVNFVDGANTTAVVTTNEDGTTSNVTYNVTGLPVTFTDKDGKPVSKIGDKYYPVNEKGQPVTPDGKPAVKTNAEGKPVTEDGTVIEPINTDDNPLQTNLVNPNVANSKEAPNNQTTSPTQLGNVANGANTFAPVDGKKMANDGKWYPADQVEPNGQPKTGAAPVDVPANIGKAGLIDFSKSNPNNAATVGDLQNLGWIVSAEGNNYSDQVRNANEVKFVGEGTATVTGKTDDKGVRTITVKVDDQVSTNNAQTPVNYTNKDGKKVYPVKDENGNVTYHTTPDGKGAGDETVPAGDVITSLNGPEGTTAPTTLNNVKNNIPAVNDADKKVTNPDGTEKGTAGDVNNINKAPLTAAEAADLLNPTKDGKPNPNFAGNNAATVSDVLNAGWNLQNNGEARDFVKPFDTVNFVNGGNTTAVVTTAADGTTSDVTFNVTGLPITYTTADGKPVSKVGDKYYPVNEKGQPIGPDGKPAVKTAPNGDLLDKDGNVIKPIDTAKDPLKSNMVNPNVANTADAPNNQTTTPTQLGNVANGAETFKPADDVKLANDGKWYPADQVEPNGKPKKDATPVASPLVAKNKAGDVLEKGNDGNWYKASDLEKGEPKPNAEEQFPEEKPENADKAGLINFENSNPNNAATVGDLQNMGFVVSAKDNGYTEQMRNANKVEFKGDNGVQVTGKTLADGTREITVALKEGRVTNNVIITDADGKEVKAVRGEDGKIYKKDPKTGKAMKEEFPIKPTDTVRNDGDGYVTGNSVATAIQKSGWNIGIGSTDKAFSEEAKTYERVNPKDNVKYVNGANTTVSMVVDAAEDKDGATVTTTYVKVDVNRDLHIDSVTTGGPAKDKAGNPLKQVNGEYYPENALVNDGKVYPAGTVMIDGKPYPAGSAKDPKTKMVLKDGKPAPEAQPLRATPKDQLADGKDGAMTVKDAKGNDGVSATAKDGKGTLTLKDAGKDGKDASQVDISTAKAPADLENTPKDAVRANDGNWYAPADVTVEVKDGKTVVTPKAGKTPIPNAPTMDRIQYTGTDGKPRNVATMDDGLRFVGDDGQTISKPLNSTMEFTGGNRENGKPVAKADTTTGNIGVFHDNGKLSIQLAKDLEKMSSANFENPDGTSTKITGNGLSITPETAKLKDPKTGKPILDKDGNPKVDATKVVSFGAPTVVTDPKTGKPMVDPATGKPVMKSGISAGGQVMSNVAQGVADTDAVNVSQLKGVANNINMRMNRMGAQAAAMGALRHLQYDPLEPTTIMAGVGAYKGEAALALGIAHYKNESTLFHAGASIGSRGDELMANAGVSWKFGSRADETAVKDTFRQGPISSSYTLQDKVSALEAQNQVQKDEINNLKAQLAEVLQYVKKG